LIVSGEDLLTSDRGGDGGAGELTLNDGDDQMRKKVDLLRRVMEAELPGQVPP
jgi:hypothetical protein